MGRGTSGQWPPQWRFPTGSRKSKSTRGTLPGNFAPVRSDGSYGSAPLGPPPAVCSVFAFVTSSAKTEATRKPRS